MLHSVSADIGRSPLEVVAARPAADALSCRRELVFRLKLLELPELPRSGHGFRIKREGKECLTSCLKQLIYVVRI